MGALVIRYYWKSGKDLKYAWDTKYKYKGYNVRAPVQKNKEHYVLKFCYIELEFPKDINFRNYYLTLYPKFLEVE